MNPVCVAVMLALLVGCASRGGTSPTTAPSRPTVTARSFDFLWASCEDTAREFGFTLDRQDYRGGVITTVPLISKQFFEVWRNDVRTIGDVANSSLATYRRTLRFEIVRNSNGTFTVTPSVTIERYVQSEQPITSSVYLRNAFRSRRGRAAIGSPEADRGIILPSRYWYVTGTDEAVEAAVAKRLARKLRR
jgi:hypothetical protein